MADVVPVSPTGQRVVLISGAFAALCAGLGALHFINCMQAMEAGSGGVGTVAISIWESGRTAAVGLTLTAVVGLVWLALCLARRNGPGTTFQLPPAWVCLMSGFLALLPGAFLYAAALKSIEAVAPKAAAQPMESVGDVAAQISRMLMGATFGGFVIPVAVLALAFLLPARKGTNASFIAWGAMCAVFILVLLHLFTKLAWLHEVAVVGSF
jgi:hypothetical protein